MVGTLYIRELSIYTSSTRGGRRRARGVHGAETTSGGVERRGDTPLAHGKTRAQSDRASRLARLERRSSAKVRRNVRRERLERRSSQELANGTPIFGVRKGRSQKIFPFLHGKK